MQFVGMLHMLELNSHIITSILNQGHPYVTVHAYSATCRHLDLYIQVSKNIFNKNDNNVGLLRNVK